MSKSRGSRGNSTRRKSRSTGSAGIQSFFSFGKSSTFRSSSTVDSKATEAFSLTKEGKKRGKPKLLFYNRTEGILKVQLPGSAKVYTYVGVTPNVRERLERLAKARCLRQFFKTLNVFRIEASDAKGL